MIYKKHNPPLRQTTRQAMKDQLKQLQVYVKTHKPLIEASLMLQRAYTMGFHEGEASAFHEVKAPVMTQGEIEATLNSTRKVEMPTTPVGSQDIQPKPGVKTD